MTTKLLIFAKPNAKKSAVVGLREDGALEVAIGAPARDGLANEELLRFLAKVLDLRKRDLALESGEGSRVKRFGIASLTVEELAARVRKVVPGEGA